MVYISLPLAVLGGATAGVYAAGNVFALAQNATRAATGASAAAPNRFAPVEWMLSGARPATLEEEPEAPSSVPGAVLAGGVFVASFAATRPLFRPLAGLRVAGWAPPPGQKMTTWREFVGESGPELAAAFARALTAAGLAGVAKAPVDDFYVAADARESSSY